MYFSPSFSGLYAFSGRPLIVPPSCCMVSSLIRYRILQKEICISQENFTPLLKGRSSYYPSHLDGLRDMFHDVRNLFGYLMIHIHDQITDAPQGLEQLAFHIDVPPGKQAVDLGQHSGHIPVDVQDTVCSPDSRKPDLG